MIRVLPIFLLALLVAPAFAGDTPIPWNAPETRAPAVDSGSRDVVPVAVAVRRSLLGDERGVLAGQQKPPERSFDDDMGEVITVDELSAEEKAYLKKEPSEAFLRSAVLPGWGQRYGERNLRGAVFTAVDVGLLTGLLLTRQQWQEGVDDYELFARQHAGVGQAPNHQYYVNIGNFDNTLEFNEAQRSQRQYADQYKDPSDYWEWDSSANRALFKDIRIEADQAKRRIYYFVGGMVLNRIVSAIDASRGLANRQEELREKRDGLAFGLGYSAATRAPALTVTW